MMHFIAVAGTSLLGVATAACLAMLLIALATPSNAEVGGDVSARRAGIIMLAVATTTLGIFLTLAILNL